MFPNVKFSIKNQKSITPLDLEQTYGLTEGDLNHGQLMLDQFLFMRPIPGWSNHKTPIDAIHFSILFVMNVNLGNITPPVGIILFATQAVGKVKMEPLVRELVPFLLIKIGIIFLITYLPFISLWLPRLFGFATGGPSFG